MYKDIKLVNFENFNLVLKLDKNLNKTTNKESLIQRIVKFILTEKGTNSFSSSFGSYFNTLILYAFKGDLDFIRSTFTLLLQNVVEYIKDEQQNELLSGNNIPDSCLLENIYLLDVNINYLESSLKILLSVITKDQIQTPIILTKEIKNDRD